MKIITFVAIPFAIFAFAACAQEVAETPISFTRDLTFTATQEGLSPETKTMRMEDGATWWQPSEEISVFYGNGSNGGSKFISKNTTLAETTEFEGSISMSGSKEFWAIYPYSTDNSCDGSSITTVIPDIQTGSEGNFSGDVFPAMAKSSSNVFAFWNICGGIKFFVSRSDIKSVTFKGNGGEMLAGKVRFSLNADGKPEEVEVLEGKTEVMLNAPDGGTFKAGKTYYITLLPRALDSGFTIVFNTANKKGVFSSDKAQTVKRSIFGVLKNIDTKVSAWESTVIEPEWIDLGLSVKWAVFNLGATKPEECGDYFAWGETESKTDYSWDTYKWCNGSGSSLTKYNCQSSYGSVDNMTELDAEDDVASVCLGGNWRMPTEAECRELLDNCTCTWIDNKDGTGVAGRIVTSNKPGYTDKSIFLPAAGWRSATVLNSVGSSGGYWSSSIYENGPEATYIQNRFSLVGVLGRERYVGQPVRPIYDDRIHPSAVTLNKTSLSLSVNGNEQLYVNVLPSNATDITVSWSSDNTDVATVDSDGNVTAIAVGTATITVTTNDGGLTSSCVVTVSIPEPVWVDLGLSVKWATFNIGASKPEGYGDYFAWGETETKSSYTEYTYKWGTSLYTMTKYSKKDNKVVLERGEKEGETVDDVAYYTWGSNWRMATYEEWSELMNADNCSWTWTSEQGVNGFRVTSKKNGYNNHSIFLPQAGNMDGSGVVHDNVAGTYWSSSVSTERYYDAKAVLFYEGNVDWGEFYRYYGFSVRPVYDDRIHPESISLNKSTLSLFVGDFEWLSATISPTDATDKTVTWSSDNTDVAIVNPDGCVIAESAGVATITATTSDGNLCASCDVTVNNRVKFGRLDVCNIYLRWATLVGSIQSDGGYDIAEYGFCIGTSANPEAASIVIPISGAMDSFQKIYKELDDNTDYCAFIYAKTDLITFYSDPVLFSTMKAPEGAAPGLFSIASEDYVYLAKGDLEYDKESDIWSFAENQCVETSGHISKFAWGTSGYNGVYPGVNNDQVINIQDTEYDWGIHNPIQNGGNIAGLWYTPTRFDLEYLLRDRDTNLHLDNVTVCDVSGFILLPDDWCTPTGVDISSTEFSEDKWILMENNGAVFIKRDDFVMNTNPSVGSYDPSRNITATALWSSSSYWAGSSYGDLYCGYVGLFPRVYVGYQYSGTGYIYLSPCSRSREIAVRLIRKL